MERLAGKGVEIENILDSMPVDDLEGELAALKAGRKRAGNSRLIDEYDKSIEQI
jgi:hypothetical protein